VEGARSRDYEIIAKQSALGGGGTKEKGKTKVSKKEDKSRHPQREIISLRAQNTKDPESRTRQGLK